MIVASVIKGLNYEANKKETWCTRSFEDWAQCHSDSLEYVIIKLHYCLLNELCRCSFSKSELVIYSSSFKDRAGRVFLGHVFEGTEYIAASLCNDGCIFVKLRTKIQYSLKFIILLKHNTRETNKFRNLNPLSANLAKWSNTPRQFVDNSRADELLECVWH